MDKQHYRYVFDFILKADRSPETQITKLTFLPSFSTVKLSSLHQSLSLSAERTQPNLCFCTEKSSTPPSCERSEPQYETSRGFYFELQEVKWNEQKMKWKFGSFLQLWLQSWSRRNSLNVFGALKPAGGLIQVAVNRKWCYNTRNCWWLQNRSSVSTFYFSIHKQNWNTLIWTHIKKMICEPPVRQHQRKSLYDGFKPENHKRFVKQLFCLILRLTEKESGWRKVTRCVFTQLSQYLSPRLCSNLSDLIRKTMNPFFEEWYFVSWFQTKMM